MSDNACLRDSSKAAFAVIAGLAPPAGSSRISPSKNVTVDVTARPTGIVVVVASGGVVGDRVEEAGAVTPFEELHAERPTMSAATLKICFVRPRPMAGRR